MATKSGNNVIVEVRLAGRLCDHISLGLSQSATDHHRFGIKVNCRHVNPRYWELIPGEAYRYIGKQLSVRLHDTATGERSSFEGIVTDIEDCDGQGTIVLKGGSPTLLLDRDRAMQCYVDQTLAGIVEKVIAKSGVRIRLENNPHHRKVINYAARYLESSYAFLARLTALYGELFYYDGTKLVVGDARGRGVEETVDGVNDFTAVSANCGITPGAPVLSAAGSEQVNYRILEVEHSVNEEGIYGNRFRAVASLKDYLGNYSPPSPGVYPQPAVVIDDRDPEERGRVRVRWFWQDDSEGTNWIRVEKPGGSLTGVPAVAEHVMVGFESGDLDKPFVIGRPRGAEMN